MVIDTPDDQISWETEYLPDLRVIETNIEEQMSLIVIAEIFKRCAELTKEWKCYRWLNVFHCEMALALFDAYEIPALFMQATESLELDRYRIRRAVVAPTIEEFLQFEETVTYNRSQEFRAFTERAEAIAWLSLR